MKRYIQLCIVLAISTLAGCKKQPSNYSPYLRPLTSYIDTNITKHGVTLRAKQLSPHDCSSLFGDRAHRLFKKHRRRQAIYPIQLSITNYTNKYIALNPRYIDLQLVEYHKVATRLQRNSLVQAFGGMAAGLLITGLLAVGSLFALSASGMLLVIIGSMQALAPIAILGGSALLVTPFFLVIGTPIVSTAKGVKTAQYNKLLAKEIKKHTLQNALIIQPHQTIDTLIFVEKRNYKNQFTVVLTNPENTKERLPFHVTLQQQPENIL